MRLTIELPDEGLTERARVAAQDAVRDEVAKLFGHDYHRKGDGYLAVEAAVADGLSRVDLAAIVDRIIAERAEVVVRERIEARLAKLVDVELKARSRVRTEAQGDLLGGSGS